MSQLGANLRIALLTILALCCVVIPDGTVSAQTTTKPSPYRITGTVVSSTDGSPVRHCHLTPSLANATGPGPGVMGARASGRGGGPPNRFSPVVANNSVDADDNGHFSITLPSPGAWTLTANARGYASGAYEQHQQYSSSIVLTPEAPTYNLVFRLSPEASITGIVLDEAGEPVRNAQVALHIVPAPLPDSSQPQVGGVRGFTQTDDRGIYEFANLLPEDNFRITVQARPWYAATAQQGRANNVTDTSSTLDPSLDVTYPLLWFPGVDDPTQAETITVHAGETYQADFHLTPIPSIHLRILTPASVDANGRAIPAFPVFERIIPGGGGNFGGGGLMPIVNMNQPGGQMEVSGLSPGTYQVRVQSQNGGPPRSAVVEITSGSVRTLDMSAISSSTANVTILLDGLPDSGPGENSIQVSLTDAETGQQFFPTNGPINSFAGPANQRRRPGSSPPDRPAPRRGRVIEVPPGQYEVTLFAGRANAYLTAITAQSADVHGRHVTVRAGDSTLTLHVAAGLATLTGNVSMHDRPTVGATVLLVPASLGDPGSFASIGRDQSNTDGSFDIAGITPGQYILIAIDHGWQINWSDPSTLRRYLTQGTPVDLTSSEKLKQKIEAQTP